MELNWGRKPPFLYIKIMKKIIDKTLLLEYILIDNYESINGGFSANVYDIIKKKIEPHWFSYKYYRIENMTEKEIKQWKSKLL